MVEKSDLSVFQIPEPDSSIQSISIDPMGTMMAAVTNKVITIFYTLRSPKKDKLNGHSSKLQRNIC